MISQKSRHAAGLIRLFIDSVSEIVEEYKEFRDIEG